MTRIFNVYRPILDGVEEVRDYASKIAQESGLYKRKPDVVKFGAHPRVSLFRAAGLTASFFSHPKNISAITQIIKNEVPEIEAETILWAKMGRFSAVALAQSALEGSPEACSELLNDEILRGIRTLEKDGVRMSDAIIKRADDMSTFSPFPIVDDPLVSSARLADIAGILSAPPKLILGPISVSLTETTNETEEEAYWANYGRIN